MLRNIPNKIDQVGSSFLTFDANLICGKAMLKEIIDKTSLGKYDFMYLRIGMQHLMISLILHADIENL